MDFNITLLEGRAWAASGSPIAYPQCGIRSQDEQITNPIDLEVSPEEKIRQLQELSKQNEPIVASFLQEIDRKYANESKASHKEPEKLHRRLIGRR